MDNNTSAGLTWLQIEAKKAASLLHDHHPKKESLLCFCLFLSILPPEKELGYIHLNKTSKKHIQEIYKMGWG